MYKPIACRKAFLRARISAGVLDLPSITLVRAARVLLASPPSSGAAGSPRASPLAIAMENRWHLGSPPRPSYRWVQARPALTKPHWPGPSPNNTQRQVVDKKQTQEVVYQDNLQVYVSARAVSCRGCVDALVSARGPRGSTATGGIRRLPP